MHGSDTVSIIVRTMGRPELDRAVESIRQQTYSNIQTVLVVANPDFSAERYREGPNMTIVRSGDRLNRPSAANAGIRAASGAWIGFLDEDDWFDPNHVSNLLQALRDRPGILLAYSDLVLHEGAKVELREVGYWKRQQCQSPAISIISSLVARDICDRCGCWFDGNFELLEDWDFVVQCSEVTDFAHVKAATAHYDTIAGSSGCGHGRNRDYGRFRPFLDRMTAKWGGRYKDLIEHTDRLEAQGRSAISKGEFHSAAQIAAEGLRYDPGNPRLLNMLATAHFRLGDGLGALAAQRRAFDSDPMSFSLLFDLVQLEHRLGFGNEAKQNFAKLSRMAASDVDRTRLKTLAAVVEVLLPDGA